MFLCVVVFWTLPCRLVLEIQDPPTSAESKGMFWVYEIYQLVNLWLGSSDHLEIYPQFSLYMEIQLLSNRQETKDEIEREINISSNK